MQLRRATSTIKKTTSLFILNPGDSIRSHSVVLFCVAYRVRSVIYINITEHGYCVGVDNPSRHSCSSIDIDFTACSRPTDITQRRTFGVVYVH